MKTRVPLYIHILHSHFGFRFKILNFTIRLKQLKGSKNFLFNMLKLMNIWGYEYKCRKYIIYL